MAGKKIDRRAFVTQTSLTLGCGCLAGALAGCDPQKDQKAETTNNSQEARVSTVPLRIRLVAPISQPETVVRQWSAISDQPIEIRSVTISELLSAEKCDADLLLYPSRLIGELIRRQWVTKLPSSLVDVSKGDQNDENLFAAIPPALVAAGIYSATAYGLPLGYSMVSMLGSASNQAEKISWEQLDSSLASYEVGSVEFQDDQVDHEALVDRFLALAFGRSDVNSKYGVLFDIRTMKPRLSSPEFLYAAQTLAKLARQPQAVLSIVGSHAEAWKWINNTEASAFALASASQLDVDSINLDSAKLVTIDDAKPWNSGSGVMASITMDCRQTAQTIKFTTWLAQTKTLETIRGLVPGLISTASRGRSLADRVVSANNVLLQQDTTVTEPRSPSAQQLRTELATQLIQLLRGKLNVEEALSATASQWTTIIKQSGSNPRAEYERALGLKE